jgi:replicative DNA helicase
VPESIAKPLPHSLEAERSVLGAALLDNSALLKMLPVLQDSDFFLPQNRVIYCGMRALAAESKPIDTTLLMDHLDAIGKLEAAGGMAYLTQLADGLPRVTNVEHYAGIVKARAKSRELISFSACLESRAYDVAESPDSCAEESITELLNIIAHQSHSIGPRPWRDVAKSAVDQLISAKMNPDKAARMFFGLKALDDMTSGLRRKELCLIVAPTSNGKTLLASQLAVSASSKNFRVLYFSAEMPAEQLAMREITYRAGVKFYFAQRPELLTTEELARLSEAGEDSLTIRIVDRDVTPTRIWALSEAAKRTAGLDLVIVDYDQLVIEAGMDPKADDDSIFRHQRNFVLAAKRMAERLDVCFVLLSQLRKVSASVARGAHPRLDDIWGDSSVRNTPHLILWLVREFFQQEMDIDFERKAKVYVLKARNGRTGIVNLDFDPERVRFLDAPDLETVRVP